MLHSALEVSAGELLGSPLMGRESKYLQDINWVAVAVDMMGGINASVAKVGVSRRTIQSWLAMGTLKTLTYDDVKRVADVCGLRVDQLTRLPPLSLRKKNGG